MSAARQATTTENIAAIRFRQARREAQILAFSRRKPVTVASARAETERQRASKWRGEIADGAGAVIALVVGGCLFNEFGASAIASVINWLIN